MGKLIGVFATEISSRVQGKVYQALHEYFKDKGYTLVFFSADLNRHNLFETDISAFELFDIAKKMEKDFCAMILHVESLQNRELITSMINFGKEKDIPVFLYDCNNYGYSEEEGVISINPDYIQGFEDNVRHLVEYHGCRNVYMVAGIEGNRFSDERIAAYKKVMTENKLDCSDDRIVYGGFWELPAIKAINELLERVEEKKLPFPEAICCANDSMAIAVEKELAKLGYKVPEDILVTGFDGIEDGKFCFPAIASCEPILDTLPEYIHHAIKNHITQDSFLIPLRFIPKESCGCVNRYKSGDEQEMACIMESSRKNLWQYKMLSNLQLSLIDSCDLNSLFGGLTSTASTFKGVSLLYCIRNDLETQKDFESAFDTVRVRLDYDFYDRVHYETFSVKDIMPDYEKLISNSENADFFIFQILYSDSDRFGYSIIKADNFASNDIIIFGQFAESFTNMLESMLRNRRLEEATKSLNEMYIRDILTGLYNRVGYYKELDNYLNRQEDGKKFIHVISADMDGLKNINDNYGHQEGDLAIRCVAETIKSCFEEPCICARFGGDEFMIAYFSDSKEKADCGIISQKLNDCLKNHPLLKDKPYPVGISVGHASGCSMEKSKIKALEKTADDNMYNDKRERKRIGNSTLI